jgi:hypothetical protein
MQECAYSECNRGKLVRRADGQWKDMIVLDLGSIEKQIFGIETRSTGRRRSELGSPLSSKRDGQRTE